MTLAEKLRLEALNQALLLSAKLPSSVAWSLTATNEDTGRSPTVFNIYINEPAWAAMQLRLNLKKQYEQGTSPLGEQYVSFRKGILCISFRGEQNDD